MSKHSTKKVAAAVAAVLQFLAESEAVPAVAPAATAAPAPAPTPAGWGLAGRQEAMALRDLWQRRIPKSW
jgi:hypothetical protein